MPSKTKVHPDQTSLPIELSFPPTPTKVEPSQHTWYSGPQVYSLDPNLWDCLFLWEFPNGEVTWTRNENDAVGLLSWLGKRYLPSQAKRWRPDRARPTSAYKYGPNRRPIEFAPPWIAYAKLRKHPLK